MWLSIRPIILGSNPNPGAGQFHPKSGQENFHALKAEVHNEDGSRQDATGKPPYSPNRAKFNGAWFQKPNIVLPL